MSSDKVARDLLDKKAFNFMGASAQQPTSTEILVLTANNAGLKNCVANKCKFYWTITNSKNRDKLLSHLCE